MKIGFTGTRKGMSSRQRTDFRRAISAIETPGEFHHGDCMGADEEAHAIVKAYGWKVVIHPPSDDSWRAWCEGDLTMVPRPHLIRNHDIVNAVDTVYAAPDSDEEKVRSGTWATIRYARVHNKEPIILKR